MSTFTVSIGGVDRTSVIDYQSFTAEIGSRENITTCSFDIIDETRAIEVKGAEAVVVQKDGSTIWSGYIGNVSTEFDGKANILAVDAQSGNNMLDQKAFRTIGYTSKGVAGSAADKGSVRWFSRTIGAEVTWLLANSTASPAASPITYSAAKIFKYTTTFSNRIDYGGKTLREALEVLVKTVYGKKKMTFWVDAGGALNIKATGQAANMLENFDFYNGETSDWTRTGATIVTAAGQSTGATGAGSVPDYGMQLTSSAQFATQTLTVVAGRRYYIAAGMKNVSANRGRLNLVWKNSGGTTISTDTLSSATTAAWVRLEGLYTAPATAATCVYTLAYSGTASGNVYFDNLQIVGEDATFGISDTPNNTTTFAPENYEESVDSSAIINAVAIRGKEYKIGGGALSLTNATSAWYTFYVEYSPSIAYFGKTFTTALDDGDVNGNTKALEAAYKIFSESAFPIREGKYEISSTKLGALVPEAGTYQIFELSRMPAARQMTINRIESVTVLPMGAGEVVYEIQFGAQKGNLASSLATVGSAMWGIGKPKPASTVFEHTFVNDNLFAAGRTLTDPQTTGVAAEVEQRSANPSVAPISVVKKNTALLPADNLPDLTNDGDGGEFPYGSIILLVPDAGDPHISKPTLYRSDGTTTWTAVTPAQLKQDATDAGRLNGAMIVADSIFAGTIDAGSIDVINLNADNIEAGTLTLTGLGATAISSTNFTVSNTGSVTAKDLTIGTTTTTPNALGNEVSGFIYARPTDNITSAQFRVVADASNNLTKSFTGITSSGAAANANCTINATAHPFAQGQFVWFTGATGGGAAALNGITEALPAQVISTTTNAFVINYYLAIGAITGGTVTGGKRLSVVAPSGLFVYQNDSAAGFVATGSLALGSSLTKLGKGSTATLADGEIGFLSATTPRYGSGANLYSSNGTSNLSTSGNFTVGGTLTAGTISATNYGLVASDIPTLALGTDTSGNYVSGLTGGTGVTISGTAGEGWSPSVAIGQSVSTAASPTFAGLTTTGNTSIGNSTGDQVKFVSLLQTSTITNSYSAIRLYNAVATVPWRAFVDSSSERFKSNIVYEDASDAILDLRSVSYHDKLEFEEKGDEAPRQRGFLAEEVAANPDGETFVVFNAEGQADAIQYDRLVVPLHSAMRKLRERIEELESRLAELENK